MRTNLRCLSAAIFLFATALPAGAQSSSVATVEVRQPLPSSVVTSAVQANPSLAASVPAVRQLLDFKESDVKFRLGDLMETLRDRRHEGWVLAAYPDPKTSRPLIGAGFSLDLPVREHPQRDLLNPQPFIEPSSAQLWQAAGLDPDRLQQILARYHDRTAKWSKKKFRKQIKTLPPDIADDDAAQLLRISAIHAIYNARAYCRNFDRLSASQQMAMSQLVYQMGVNLEQFSQFLDLVNRDISSATLLDQPVAGDTDYWKSVQLSLTQSQWARLYRTRATSVIAMLDPRYSDDPSVAERRVGAILRPAVAHRHAGRHNPSIRRASYTRHQGSRAHRRASRKRSD